MKARITTPKRGRTKRITLHGVNIPNEVTIKETEYFISIARLNLDSKGRIYKVQRINDNLNAVNFATDLQDGIYSVDDEDGTLYINL
jgi:hypothetical protein